MTSPPAVPGPPLRCRLGWTPTVEWAGLYLAEADGLLTAEGVSVALLPGGPGRPGAASDVAAGVADVALASDLLAVLEVIGAGAPLRVVAATMGASPLGVAWPAERGVPTMAALLGMRIGAGSDNDRAVLDALFAGAGLDPDYAFVEIGPDTTELEAGRIDAMCCSTISQPAAAARRGVALATATFAELGLPMPADVVAVPTELIETRRPEVVGFLRALARGWAANEADPSRAPALAVARFGADWGYGLDAAVDENERQRPFVRHAPDRGLPYLAIDEAALGASLDALGRAGVAGLPAVADAVELSLLAEAHAAGR